MSTQDAARKFVGGIDKVIITGDTQLDPDKSYFVQSSTTVHLTLPTTIAVGQSVSIAGIGAGTFNVVVNGGQTIHHDGTDVFSSLNSSDQYNFIELVCTNADLEFATRSFLGTFTVPATTTEPIFKTSIINSKPVVRFDGTDDILYIPHKLSTYGASATFFLVAANSGNNTNAGFVFSKVSASFAGVGVTHLKGWSISLDAGSGWSDHQYDSGIPTVIDNQFNVMTCRYTAGGSNDVILRVDGTNWAVDNNTSPANGNIAQNTDPWSVGGLKLTSPYEDYYGGDIAEILYFNRALNLTEIGQIESYLNQKYNLNGGGTLINPTTISGLQIWLKADSMSLPDGASVGSWADSSGNNNNASVS